LSLCLTKYKILNKELKQCSNKYVLENQNVFRKGGGGGGGSNSSSIDVTFCVKLIIKKRKDNSIWKHILHLWIMKRP